MIIKIKLVILLTNVNLRCVSYGQTDEESDKITDLFNEGNYRAVIPESTNNG